MDGAAQDFANLMPCGTPDEVLEKLAFIRDTINANGFMIGASYAGMPYQEADRNLRCFVEHVLPEVKRWEGSGSRPGACRPGRRPKTARRRRKSASPMDQTAPISSRRATLPMSTSKSRPRLLPTAPPVPRKQCGARRGALPTASSTSEPRRRPVASKSRASVSPRRRRALLGLRPATTKAPDPNRAGGSAESLTNQHDRRKRAT